MTWYVTSRATNGGYWMIKNSKTGKSKKIGPFGGKTNNFDKAMAEAKKRNKDGKRPKYKP